MSRAADSRRDAAPDVPDDVEALATADLQLSELVETMERVDWRHVPTVSVSEAAAWNARLVEARDAVREQAATGGGDGR